jgi:hypothetical protein
MVHTAIFLGAGASKAEGAPLQGQLFHDYFTSDPFKDRVDPMDQELETFFSEMFQIDVRDADHITFPTFEEVLGLTDLAIMRKESFRTSTTGDRAATNGRLRLIAQYLVFLVAKVLDTKLRGSAIHHHNLVSALHHASELRNVVFVSTNYDILIDNALTEKRSAVDLDYGVELRNFERTGDWERPALDRSVQLFKPHGSLNWLFCPTCNELEITPQEKGVIRLISDFAHKTCEQCGSVYSPLIVPPTFYKDLNNVFLSSIWNRTDVTLRKVGHVIFCGYSFPDADMHIKYLLKRAQTNRNGRQPLKITVINNHDGKKRQDCQQEKDRYIRFLGDTVEYTKKSFADFAGDPLSVLRP